jgi:predicted transcriptional regulator
MTASNTGFKRPGSEDGDQADGRRRWVFLSNHGNVLLCIVRDPTVRISEIAHTVGIGERATQKIVADLVADGYVSRTKEGRRNRYRVNPRAHLRHPMFADLELGPVLEALRDGAAARTQDESA